MHARVEAPHLCMPSQMCVLDGKQFCALEEAGRQYMDEEVDACVLTHNLQARAHTPMCTAVSKTGSRSRCLHASAGVGKGC